MPPSETAPTPPSGTIDAVTVLNCLGAAVLVLAEENRIAYVNSAAEQLFESSFSHLTSMSLTDLLPADSPVVNLAEQARGAQIRTSEYGVMLDSIRTGQRMVTVQVVPIAERPRWVVLSLLEHTLAIKIGQQLSHRHAARSVTAMAAVLAHEIKNPLSGIRGAAQLLEEGVSAEDRPLTQLIRDEADRIVALVDRMEVFADDRPLERQAVNIHLVLEHVRRVAENGFARGVRIIERYDPSLPPVLGNRDQLVQVFLNLIKNAAEAVVAEGGEVVLATGYRHGVRVSVPGSTSRVSLPLVISVQDNGPGIPADLHQHLFDPFVTTKKKGTGLGLALVAKIVSDHGGIVEFDSMPRRTVFRVMLPMYSEPHRELGNRELGNQPPQEKDRG
ncbi:two-component system sensor histidine kinase NtrB [Roseospirillum parvum]|uniref:histidine kinase n=1 Tax=Roseospirillum parvum TaxID=83401 RepID=A0A1G7YA29_9PROT|nr:ATP-binding protein [Roseospirillum parvum]SDG93318.1 two-component system, NtrC family, nitrogen regulation sensor histidine kinase GlnL [Roseospirillum parvum]